MKKKMLAVAGAMVVAMVAALSLAPGAAQAGNNSRPLTGQLDVTNVAECVFNATFSGLICDVSLDGSINVTHLGKGTMTGLTQVEISFAPGSCVQMTDEIGHAVWTAANGDVINWDIVANVSCDGDFNAQYVVSDDDPGTGRFSDAVGEIDVSGQIIPVDNDFENFVFTSVSPDLEVSGWLDY